MHKKSVKTGQNWFFEATELSKTGLKRFGCGCRLPIFRPKYWTKPDFKTLIVGRKSMKSIEDIDGVEIIGIDYDAFFSRQGAVMGIV